MGDMDPWDHPDTKAWVQNARDRLVPMLENSAVTVSIAPSDGAGDIKFAVELGLSIMMDKPILLLAAPGQQLPPKLRGVADVVCHADMSSPLGQAQVQEAITRFLTRYGPGAS